MKSITSTLFTILSALALLATACGGGDSNATVAASDVSSTDDAAPESSAATEETEPEPANEPESTSQSARVTLSTGEVFEMTPASCENQNTDPNDLLNDDFVDLFARTDDGFSFQVLNARSVGQEPAAAQVELAGKRDENGVNAKISYISAPGVLEGTILAVDGRRVTGESTIDARFSAEKPYGEEVVATFEFNC